MKKRGGSKPAAFLFHDVILGTEPNRPNDDATTLSPPAGTVVIAMPSTIPVVVAVAVSTVPPAVIALVIEISHVCDSAFSFHG